MHVAHARLLMITDVHNGRATQVDRFREGILVAVLVALLSESISAHGRGKNQNAAIARLASKAVLYLHPEILINGISN